MRLGPWLRTPGSHPGLALGLSSPSCASCLEIRPRLRDWQGAPCRMKTRGLSFKTYQESQDSSSRAVTAGSPACGPPRSAPAPLREALPNPDDPSSLPAPPVFPTSALPLRLRAASLQPSLTPPFSPGTLGPAARSAEPVSRRLRPATGSFAAVALRSPPARFRRRGPLTRQ